jgi:lysophospholipase L1-like esterase
MSRIAAAAFLAAALTATGAEAKTVAVVGDSISVGLADQLARLDPYDKVESFGVVGSGLTSTKLADWPRRAIQVAAGHPDGVVVQIGTNDAVAPLPRDYRVRVDAFLAPFIANGARVVCLEPLPPVRPDLVKGMPAVEATLRDACTDFGAQWVPVGGVPAGERAADHVHLDGPGYARLAGIALTAIHHHEEVSHVPQS